MQDASERPHPALFIQGAGRRKKGLHWGKNAARRPECTVLSALIDFLLSGMKNQKGACLNVAFDALA